MQIYLPIAEISVNLWVLIALGGLTGVLSGMFGVGGGFLTTPFLMFIGVPPAVAVATSANQIVATSFSGFLSYMKKSAVDFKMGTYLLAGGIIGSSLGVVLFAWIKRSGYMDVFVPVSYALFLGTVGISMAIESTRSLKGKIANKSNDKPSWKAKLPFQIFFPHSKIKASALLPLSIGAFVGVMVSVMGVGGGFLIIPALIYVIGIPAASVVGTSLFQIIFITAHVTILQAITTQTVDILLAIILLSGSVVGAQFGSKIGSNIPPVILRIMLSVLVISVSAKLAFGLFVTPVSLYTVVAK